MEGVIDFQNTFKTNELLNLFSCFQVSILLKVQESYPKFLSLLPLIMFSRNIYNFTI